MTQPDDPTPPEVLADLVPVTFIYDATLGSPGETQVYSNTVAAVSKNIIPLPVRGTFLGRPGYSRQLAGAWQWVMQGDVDPVDTFVDSIPGGTGWANSSSRTVFKTLVQRLFSAGIPRSTINSQVPAMFQAVKAEVLAEQAAATP